MKASIPYIEKKFEEFNRLMFTGRLPKLPIVLADAKTFFGVCHSRVKTLPDGRKEHFDFKMRINTRIDMPEQQIEDIIIHEMIHYFINYNGLQDTSSHGIIFMAIMKSINDAFHRHISITQPFTPEQRQQALNSRKTWHVIAVINFHQGNPGVKVLPRVGPKIINFYSRFSTSANVKNVELYLSNNTFFNRFPTSAILRCHVIDSSILKTNLHDALIIKVEGSKLISTNEKHP